MTIRNINVFVYGTNRFYGAPMPDDEAVALLRYAVEELGVDFFDTAEAYQAKDPESGKILWNEEMLGKAAKAIGREKFIIATKMSAFSAEAPAKGEHMKQACARSLARLDVDYIDLYYLHRVDPNTAIEESVATLAELVKEGKIKYIGLSEASPDVIRRAHAVHPITCVQQEWSLQTRDLEADIVPVCREAQQPRGGPPSRGGD